MSYILTEKLTHTIAMYMVLKRLLTKWENWDAAKLGIIDKDGKRLRKPRTKKERDSFTIFDRFVWALKRLVTKTIGDNKLVYLFSAAYLMKEDINTIIKSDLSKYDTELEDFTVDKQKLIYEVLQEMEKQNLICESHLDFETNLIKIVPKCKLILDKTNINSIFESNQYAYHYGDLGVGWDTTRKHMSGGRGTGHFGTGTYFLGKPQGAGYGRVERPLHTVDLSIFDLYKPSDPRKFHDAMRIINRLAGNDDELSGYISGTDIERRTKVDDAAFTIWIDYSARQPIEKIKSIIIDEVQKERDGKISVSEQRTCATRVLARLGYDGVDVRGTELDNTDYGTVVFLNPDGSSPRFDIVNEKTVISFKLITEEGEAVASAPATTTGDIAQYTPKLLPTQRRKFNPLIILNHANKIQKRKRSKTNVTNNI